MRTVTLVIDMQRDFFAHQRLAKQRGQLVASTNQLVGASRQHGVPVIWIKTEFSPDLHDAYLEVRKKGIRVVISGTEGAEFLPELDIGENDLVLIKKRYSAFFGTRLDELLQAEGITRLIVSGINTHACIRATVVDAYQRDLEVILTRDCIDSHDAQLHAASWRYMDGKLGTALDSEEVAATLADARGSRGENVGG